VLPAMRRLVVAVPPTSRQDATVLMSSACRFLADAPPPDHGLAMLTEEEYM